LLDSHGPIGDEVLLWRDPDGRYLHCAWSGVVRFPALGSRQRRRESMGAIGYPGLVRELLHHHLQSRWRQRTTDTQYNSIHTWPRAGQLGLSDDYVRLLRSRHDRSQRREAVLLDQGLFAERHEAVALHHCDVVGECLWLERPAGPAIRAHLPKRHELWS